MQPTTARLIVCIACCFFYFTGISQSQTFYFPQKLIAKNNYSAEADFCCSGVTVPIYNNNKRLIGYINYYGFSGSYNIGNDESIAKTFSILVSGVQDYSDHAERIKSAINFSASELYPNAQKKLTVGELTYTVTISSVKKYSDPQYYMMGSVRAKVDVDYPAELIPAKQDNNTPANTPADNSTTQEPGEPVKKILEDGSVEIDYSDGHKRIIGDGTITDISANGQRSVYEMETVAPFIPPDLPNGDITRWLNTVNANLLLLISEALNNDQASIDHLKQGEAGLNIYQIINRRFKFLSSLNSN